MAEQRVEFVNRDDVADALFACTRRPEARGKIFNIAGGKTWQMQGEEYAMALYGAMGLDPKEAMFSSEPGWFDWYDTTESQALLQYQNTPFSEFVAQLRQAAGEAFGH
jgi:nucleoside-diphosphate-sugar epimerase